MYAAELRCLNPVADTKKSPLPILEDLAEAATALIAAGLQPDKEPRKDFNKIMHTVGGLQEWSPTTRGPYNQDLRLNTHIGAGGAMTPGKI